MARFIRTCCNEGFDSEKDMPASQLTLPRTVSPKVLVFGALGLSAILAFPGHAVDATLFAVENLVLTSPLIAFGVILTAGVTASGSMALIASAFEGRDFRMIGAASVIGALTPVCGVSVLPLVAALLAARVPLAPVMAFWLSSPITGPGMLAITVATLGTSFAIGKTVLAVAIGLFGGGVTCVLVRRLTWLDAPVRQGALIATAQDACGTAGSTEVRWDFWREKERRRAFGATAYATGKLMLIWLLAAFIAEYFLRAWLPPDMIGRFVGSETAWAVPIAAVIGAPIYLDGYASLPLVRGLIDAGMSNGAAMAFLIAGGITSAWAAIPVYALVRLPVFALYIVLAVVSALLSGFAFGLAAG
ncbi:MAG: permease [Hyphomicrobiales bacterium]